MNKQSGFTLIEIVMVLVLLGILSAVAVPKYFDLQEQAKLRAGQAAVAEAQARVNALFAEALLNGAKCSDAVNYAQHTDKTDNYTSDFVNGKEMSGWMVSWTPAQGKEPQKDFVVKEKSGTGDDPWVPVVLTKIQGYTPQIVVPNCSN